MTTASTRPGPGSTASPTCAPKSNGAVIGPDPPRDRPSQIASAPPIPPCCVASRSTPSASANWQVTSWCSSRDRRATPTWPGPRLSWIDLCTVINVPAPPNLTCDGSGSCHRRLLSRRHIQLIVPCWTYRDGSRAVRRRAGDSGVDTAAVVHDSTLPECLSRQLIEHQLAVATEPRRRLHGPARRYS